MKRILISQRIYEHSCYAEVREALASDWGSFFNAVGFLPIPMLSRISPNKYFDEFKIDGLVLSGGNDLSIFDSSSVNSIRDSYETELLNLAVERKLPTLGVCRGMQVIANYYNLALNPTSTHVGLRHAITTCDSVTEKNRLSNYTEVNSFHSFQLMDCGQSFNVLARALDGGIEAMEHKKLPIYAVMWHPEREIPFNACDIDFFQSIFG